MTAGQAQVHNAYANSHDKGDINQGVSGCMGVILEQCSNMLWKGDHP